MHSTLAPSITTSGFWMQDLPVALIRTQCVYGQERASVKVSATVDAVKLVPRTDPAHALQHRVDNYTSNALVRLGSPYTREDSSGL